MAIEGHAAVIGAGVMGAGIAQVLATSGWSVCCHDTDSQRLEDARQVVRVGRFGLDRAVSRGKISPQAASEALERLSFETCLEASVVRASLVVEAITEDLAAKVALFRQLDCTVGSDAILASNSSGLPISALAAATNRPEAVVGWHWASPAQVQRLAEIVTTPLTSEATVHAVIAAARRCGKNPIVVADHPRAWGFVVNRVFASAFTTARSIVEEGIASEEQVDQLLRDAFGWEAGVFGIAQGAASGWQ